MIITHEMRRRIGNSIFHVCCFSSFRHRRLNHHKKPTTMFKHRIEKIIFKKSSALTWLSTCSVSWNFFISYTSRRHSREVKYPISYIFSYNFSSSHMYIRWVSSANRDFFSRWANMKAISQIFFSHLSKFLSLFLLLICLARDDVGDFWDFFFNSNVVLCWILCFANPCKNLSYNFLLHKTSTLLIFFFLSNFSLHKKFLFSLSSMGKKIQWFSENLFITIHKMHFSAACNKLTLLRLRQFSFSYFPLCLGSTKLLNLESNKQKITHEKL